MSVYLRGWYIPAEDEPEGDSPFWNPYWTDGAGNWIEAQTEGHVEVKFPDEIQWPLFYLAPEAGVLRAPERSDASS